MGGRDLGHNVLEMYLRGWLCNWLGYKNSILIEGVYNVSYRFRTCYDLGFVVLQWLVRACLGVKDWLWWVWGRRGYGNRRRVMYWGYAKFGSIVPGSGVTSNFDRWLC